MRVLIAIDKFKGSLTSIEAGTIIKDAIASQSSKYKTTLLPIADGGDGFADVCKHYLKTKTVKVKSTDPLFNKMVGYYEWNYQTKTAIIELAVCSGIALLPKHKKNPLLTSTYGTGILIKHAISKGAKKIILGIGGSATNDAGMGIANALGFTFFDKNGNELMPIGASLNHVHSIDAPEKMPKVSFDIATDVQNVLYGTNGAAYIYGPQKGANAHEVIQLDKGLRNIASIIKQTTKVNLSKVRGMGAAGGVTAMLFPFFKTRIISGINLVMEISNFNKHISNTDLLITGEGKIDDQSFQGKVVGAFLKHANMNKVDVLLVAGVFGATKKIKARNLQVIELAEKEKSIDYAIKNAKKLLFKKVKTHFTAKQ
ncbi:MAG: hypothetical protein RL377_885 [Bacteroidota bacterium]